MSKDKFNEFVATVESMAGHIDDVGHGVLWASSRIDELIDQCDDTDRELQALREAVKEALRNRTDDKSGWLSLIRTADALILKALLEKADD